MILIKLSKKVEKNSLYWTINTSDSFSKTFLSGIKDENRDLAYDFLGDNDGARLSNAIQENINEIKEKEVPDYIILLTNIGVELEKYTSNGLLSKLEGVTAILDGHTHKIYNRTYKDKNGNLIPVSQVGIKL